MHKRPIHWSFWGLVFLAIGVGLYPLLMLVAGQPFGLLSTKSVSLLQDQVWKGSFYTHVLLGAVALLIGWVQFLASVRKTYPRLHRLIGKTYLVSVMLSSLTGVYIALYATGGIIATFGFAILGVVWFQTTFQAYRHARQRHIVAHQRMMTYSYAATLAAVTLRIWLPSLSFILGDFILAFQLSAWLCWIPNLIAAYGLIHKSAHPAQKSIQSL